MSNLVPLNADGLRHEVFVCQLFPLVFVTPPLQHEIARDSKQKWPKRSAAWIKTGRQPQQCQKHFLGYVFGSGRRIHHAPREAVDGILVLFECGLEFVIRHSVVVTVATGKRYGRAEKRWA